MAVSGCLHVQITSSPFECRSDSDLRSSPRMESAGYGRFSCQTKGAVLSSGGMSSLIFRFPPNFVRQLSTKVRRNCSNIGVPQVVTASWSNNNSSAAPSRGEVQFIIDGKVVVEEDDGSWGLPFGQGGRHWETEEEVPSFFSTDGSLAVHAGERLGHSIVSDAITTPVVNTSAYFFKKICELMGFKGKCRASFEYGHYENPTSVVAEEKISALEGAESTLIMASGMCASTVMLMALVPAGGHIVTTTDCYRKTRIFMETILPKMGVKATVIDPTDIEGLKSALEKNKVSLLFTESPTNYLFRCVDIKLVSNLCHSKGALVCIDGTFATPLNQKVLALGADLVLHSATKFIGGHNDVLAGSISGSLQLITKIRNLHHVLGGALNPNAAYLIIRGIKTLHLRVQQQNSTALRMAKILEAHPKVKRVYYPGLPSHPEYVIAMKQMTGFGGVSFEIDGDLMTTIKFVDALTIPYIAPSFGGCESTVNPPAIMSWGMSPAEEAKFGIVISDNFVRFSFGVEDFEDLKADILHALETVE